MIEKLVTTRKLFIQSCMMMLLFGSSSTVFAEDFSTTNVQLLYGNNFHDSLLDNNTTDGRMTTMTLEHFGTWEYGDNYFFTDFTSANFADSTGKSTGIQTHIYGEWAPRLSLSAMSGHDLSFGVVKDLLLAGQINQSGNNFMAYMLGMSAQLDIPAFNNASLSAYGRKDKFNRSTWQVTGVWSVPIMSALHLNGFLDLYGTDNLGTELITQPQLLLDAGQLFGGKEHIYIGVEWYYTRNSQATDSSIQGMVKWAW